MARVPTAPVASAAPVTTPAGLSAGPYAGRSVTIVAWILDLQTALMAFTVAPWLWHQMGPAEHYFAALHVALPGLTVFVLDLSATCGWLAYCAIPVLALVASVLTRLWSKQANVRLTVAGIASLVVTAIVMASAFALLLPHQAIVRALT